MDKLSFITIEHTKKEGGLYKRDKKRWKIEQKNDQIGTKCLKTNQNQNLINSYLLASLPMRVIIAVAASDPRVMAMIEIGWSWNRVNNNK